DERWVQALYRDVLGRAGEPAGVAAHLADLAAGAPPVQVGRTFLDSEEHRQRLVRALHERLLGAAPDDATRERLVQRLRDGAEQREVWLDLLASAAYQARHPGPDAFVRALYRDVLGREGEPAGVAGHLQALLLDGDRRARARAFLTSREHHENHVRAAFQRLLQRSPGPAEESAHVDHLAAGGRLEDVDLALVASAEHFDRAAAPPPPPPPPPDTSVHDRIPDAIRAQALAVLNELVTRYPVEWREAHAHIDIQGRPTAVTKERAEAFAKLAAWELHTRVSPRIGLNRKRGDPRGDFSMDCFAYKRRLSDPTDCLVIDYIANAGISPDYSQWLRVNDPARFTAPARIEWSDVSIYAPGLFVQPPPPP
ncbi:MAG: DUF4214 domain-containing protein, partial [Planctomycetes bacterium]|nr:DUF4214 domain-containing protein [Planctomycetota bacterium]